MKTTATTATTATMGSGVFVVERGVERGGVAALHEHSVAAACEETIHEVRMGEHYTEYIYLGKHNLQVCWY